MVSVDLVPLVLLTALLRLKAASLECRLARYWMEEQQL